MSRIEEIRVLMAAAEADLVDVGGFAANELLRDDIQLDPAFSRFGMPVVGILANAPAWLAYLLEQLDAIDQRLADDRANLRGECAGMSTAELVKAALDEREGAVDQGWGYADVVEREGAADRMDRDGEIARLNGLVARMVPLVNHSEAAGCPMAFHRSDGEECTCGALAVVKEARS